MATSPLLLSHNYIRHLAARLFFRGIRWLQLAVPLSSLHRDFFEGILSTVTSSENDVASDEEGKMARMSLGWNIFPSPRLHGAGRVLGHQGTFDHSLHSF
jgi:hypothetical protein